MSNQIDGKCTVYVCCLSLHPSAYLAPARNNLSLVNTVDSLLPVDDMHEKSCTKDAAIKASSHAACIRCPDSNGMAMDELSCQFIGTFQVVAEANPCLSHLRLGLLAGYLVLTGPTCKNSRIVLFHVTQTLNQFPAVNQKMRRGCCRRIHQHPRWVCYSGSGHRCSALANAFWQR